jgi:hypothetical protein
MPVFLLVVGAFFLIAAVRGTEYTNKLIAVLKDDFTGPNNFFVWALAIGSIGALTYSEKLKPFAQAALGLVFVAILLTRKGPTGKDFLSSFFDQIRATEG